MDWLIGIAIGIVCGAVSALIVNLLFGRLAARVFEQKYPVQEAP